MSEVAYTTIALRSQIFGKVEKANQPGFKFGMGALLKFRDLLVLGCFESPRRLPHGELCFICVVQTPPHNLSVQLGEGNVGIDAEGDDELRIWAAKHVLWLKFLEACLHWWPAIREVPFCSNLGYFGLGLR